ncbi:exodeoxyribonuclease VII small subunit [Micromonospora zhanjiangensis]|uniref:Exodeoxyribonuclease 7 small subunit n=1 Tax=Micromonospora zhanjiangensis TaxID=1522057 RepID=A0ABV8KMN7_9ACTN
MTDQKIAATGRTKKPAGSDERPSYEQARAELASVVERLEAGGVSLEESLALWERGERLAEICQGWLDGARERLDTARRSREPATEG